MRIIDYRKDDFMKYRVLVKKLNELGWYYKKSGGRHDVFTKDGKIMPIPRHKEINEITAKEILKKAGLK